MSEDTPELRALARRVKAARSALREVRADAENARPTGAPRPTSVEHESPETPASTRDDSEAGGTH